MEKDNKIVKTNLSRRKITEYFALDKFNADNDRLDGFSEQVELFAEKINQELPTKATKEELQKVKEEIDKKDKAQDERLDKIDDDLLSKASLNDLSSLEAKIEERDAAQDQKITMIDDSLKSKPSKSDLEEIDNKVVEHASKKASKSDYGHVKIGDGLEVSDGVISATPVEVTDIPVASESDAKAGTNNTKMMTPLRTDQAINNKMGNVVSDVSTVKSDITQIKSDVSSNKSGISSKLGRSGGTMTGQLKAYSNSSYTTAQVRNIICSTSSPSSSQWSNGDIWIVYK